MPASVAHRIAAIALVALWLALVIGTTSGFGWIASWHNEQRAVQVAALACTSLALAALAASSDWRVIPGIDGFLIAAAVIGGVSAARAAWPAEALADLSLAAALCGLVVACTTHFRARTSARHAALMAAFGLGAIHVFAIGVRYATALALHRTPDLDVLLLGYANPRFPSALHALLLPFIAQVATTSQPRGLRTPAFITLACLWAISIALETRAVLFAYLIALPTVAWLVGPSRCRALHRTLLLTAVAGVAVYLVLFIGVPMAMDIPLPARVRPEANLFLSKRDLLWASAAEAIVRSPWFGIGPGQFAALPGVWSAHPHNWVLQLAAEWGVVAAGLACIAVGRLARRISVAAPLATDVAPLAASATAVAVALAYGLVDGNLVMPVSQTVAALALAQLLATLPVTRDGPTGTRRMRSSVEVAVVLLCTGVLVAYASRTEPLQAQRIETYLNGPPPGRALWPRFWEQGFVP